MILGKPESNVVTSANVGESTSFAIRASAEAFRMLSSGMYSDKIGAVLREIGCNAADAHVEAGIRYVPFVVKLPNRLDASFYIQDFGPGLDDETIRNLYNTYFASTKQTNNEMTGAFGLGSKSPFAYTDSFTVTSVHNGVQRVYTAHLNEEGCPALTMMSEGPATDDWKNGISVGFPVNPSDFTEFHQKAGRIYRFFSPAPRVLGLEKDLAAPRFEINDETFMFRSKESAMASAAVLMGNVTYPVSISRLNLDVIEEFKAADTEYRAKYGHAKSYTELQNLLSKMMSMNLYLKMPIGSVMVTGSREELDYNPKTRSALGKALLDAAKRLGQHLRAIVDDESLSVWQRRVNARKFVTQTFDGGYTFDASDILATWRFAGLPEDHLEYFEDTVMSLPDGLGNREVKLQYIGEPAGRAKSAWCKTVFMGFYGNSQKPLLGVNEYSAIIVADKPHAAAHVKNAANKGLYKTALLISAAKVNHGQRDQIVKLLQDHFGGIPVLKSSELEPVAIKRYARNPDGTKVARPPRPPRSDFRQVTVHYFAGPQAGTSEKMTIAEVPESCLYYIMRKDLPGRGQKVEYSTTFRYNAISGEKRGFERALEAVNNAVKEGLDGLEDLEIEGYIEVTGKEYVSWKVEEYEFQPLIEEIAQYIESDEVQEQFSAILADMPHSTFRENPGQLLVSALRANNLFGKVVREQLEGTVVGAMAMAEAADAKQQRTPAQELLVTFVKEFNRFRTLMPKSFALLADAEERAKVDGLVTKLLPTYCKIIEGSHYFWRNQIGQDTLPGLEPVMRAMLTPEQVEHTAQVAEQEAA